MYGRLAGRWLHGRACQGCHVPHANRPPLPSCCFGAAVACSTWARSLTPRVKPAASPKWVLCESGQHDHWRVLAGAPPGFMSSRAATAPMR